MTRRPPPSGTCCARAFGHTPAWISRSLLILTAALLAGCDSPMSTAPATSPRTGAATPAAASDKTQPPITQTCTQCTVAVDVKNGNDQGKINLNGIGHSTGNNGSASGASLPVAVLGNGHFDLSKVSLSSLRIGDATTTPVTQVEQLEKKYQASIVDLNGDGIPDLMLHFSIQDMVDNGNLSASTTSLCVVGSGPGYTLKGCGPVTVTGSAGGASGGGYTLTDLLPWGYDSPGTDSVWVGQVPYTVADPATMYPGWETVGLSSLGSGTWATWQHTVLPLANETPEAQGFLTGTCGIDTPLTTPIVWASYQQAVLRTDVRIPAGARKVTLQFLVDDNARVFVNGTEVTSGFQTAQVATCVSYANVVTVPVPGTILSPSGVDKVAVWTRDTYGYLNYFDMHITADLKN